MNTTPKLVIGFKNLASETGLPAATLETLWRERKISGSKCGSRTIIFSPEKVLKEIGFTNEEPAQAVSPDPNVEHYLAAAGASLRSARKHLQSSEDLDELVGLALTAVNNIRLELQNRQKLACV